ncbi:hypothetical protein HHK36_024673 [Tetracentron sinense]|uniref:NAC domain-containing protein n=1 Tax=Tetracentron sinense TaxID=13715 RepID=A0A835D4V5_TETSI|nr:hypothetical protein HHK36_024673 [Tetracentron sinense]
MEDRKEEDKGGEPSVEEALGSSLTMEKVAAAKQFIESHYRAQMKNMQERMERTSMEEKKSSHELPPGFRFHPTDEELIMYYLQNQVKSMPCPVSIIPEIDIYKFDPWELPEKAEFGENEWYFFSPRDRKYPNGVRPNRATGSGYWKATGTDKAIHSGSKYVGVKKALVFYKGRPPKGVKTDWIMHEYRLCDSRTPHSKRNGSMRLDDWVLCRIYKKKHPGRAVEEKVEQIEIAAAGDASDQQMVAFPRTCSLLANLMDAEYLASISHILSDDPFSETIESQTSKGNVEEIDHNHCIENFEPGDMSYQFTNSTKFQVNQNNLFKQPIFLNSVYEFQ